MNQKELKQNNIRETFYCIQNYKRIFQERETI
jgi:hypothetical protein